MKFGIVHLEKEANQAPEPTAPSGRGSSLTFGVAHDSCEKFSEMFWRHARESLRRRKEIVWLGSVAPEKFRSRISEVI